MKLQRFSSSQREERYLEAAFQLSKLSDMNSRHGAILVKSNSVISMGVNKYRNNPFHEISPIALSYHAEIVACRQATEQSLKGAVMYVARVGRRGTRLYSEPCFHCATTLELLGIKKVVYT